MTKPANVIQIRVLFGSNPIHLTELNPSRGFSIGENGCDFMVPSEVLGVERLQLVAAVAGGIQVSAPAGAELSISASASKPSEAARVTDAACSVDLLEGGTVRWTRGALTFEVSSTVAEARVARAIVDEDMQGKLAYFGASLFSVGSLLAVAAFFVPPLGLTHGEDVDADQLVAMQAYLEAAAERERERPVEPETGAQNGGGETGAAAEGASGTMGKPETVVTQRKFQKQGPKENVEATLQRVEEARGFGIIGLLSAGAESEGPTAPWGRDFALGNDDVSAFGNMWGEDIGEAGGTGGLGLLGPAQGGGGDHEGIGLGDVRTIDGGNGQCRMGENCGFDSGINRGGHVTKAPLPRPAGDLILSGQLPKEVIQRVVRQNFGRFRHCYEQGLARNPNLRGRVAVRFLISRDGSVSSAANSASSMPDDAVTSCVVGKFYGISFPKPENGSVTVTYPLMFTPS